MKVFYLDNQAPTACIEKTTLPKIQKHQQHGPTSFASVLLEDCFASLSGTCWSEDPHVKLIANPPKVFLTHEIDTCKVMMKHVAGVEYNYPLIGDFEQPY